MDVRINFYDSTINTIGDKSPHSCWLNELTFKVGPQNGVTSYACGMFGGVPLREQKRRKKLPELQKQQEEEKQREKESSIENEPLA